MELTFYNPNNELTFSADGITYSYVGQASATGIVQAGSDPIENYCGSSTYTISWAGDIVVVLPLKTNGPTVLVETTQSGSTWTITVMKGNGTLDALGFPVQEYTEVYVFGAPPSTATSQFMIYDVNGVLSGDLSRRPLLSKGILTLSADPLNHTWTPPSPISSPGIMGVPYGYNTSSTQSGMWTNKTLAYAWILETSGAVTRTTYQTAWTKDEASIGNSVNLFPAAAIMTTVAGL
jgi:hypothetical protein